ncbi:MAG TPA: type II toxin-antitoxin system Phd/YefM family antitoxin [Thermoflexus sp.]|nr:type II toxin-antitoxin system Phd/YefM family antitoxin [Thermoflexus sp.]
MPRVVSATQARIRLGELMRWAVETHEPITVERDGRPYVVILSVEAYRQLAETQAHPNWQEVLNQIREFRAYLRAWRGGKPLTPPEEVLRQLREERDAQLTGLS